MNHTADDRAPTRRGLLLATARAVCVAAVSAGALLLLSRNARCARRERTACRGCGLRDHCEDAALARPREAPPR